MPVTDAVLPVAGLATRLHPLTKAVPKALLPLAGKTILDHCLAELAGAGIERVVIVCSPRDGAIARHLAPDPELARRLVARGLAEAAQQARDPSGGLAIELVEQPHPRGLGDALTWAAPRIESDYAIALGDAVVEGPVLARLIALHEREQAALTIALEEVAAERVSSYGIADLRADGTIGAIVEKPAPASAPSRMAVAARYVAGPLLDGALAGTRRGSDGEVSVTDAIAALIEAGEKVVGMPLAPGERRTDVGTVESYTRATRA